MDPNNINDIASTGTNVLTNFVTKFTTFISSTSLIEWILILFIIIVGSVVWHLINKYNLEINLWPKKPKKKII